MKRVRLQRLTAYTCLILFKYQMVCSLVDLDEYRLLRTTQAHVICFCAYQAEALLSHETRAPSQTCQAFMLPLLCTRHGQECAAQGVVGEARQAAADGRYQRAMVMVMVMVMVMGSQPLVYTYMHPPHVIDKGLTWQHSPT